MRYLSYVRDGSTGTAVQVDSVWRDMGTVSLLSLIQSGQDLSNAANATSLPEIDISKLKKAPLIANPPKIICVGLNYLDHAAESPYKDTPAYPAVFPRFATTLIGDGEAIERPLISEELDFEGELVAIIGKSGRHIPREKALEHVAGYSIFNEGSVRDYQFKSPQWTVGKNFDNTGAFGPYFVTSDELPRGASGLKIETRLNGQVMQSGNTADMIFPVDELIATLSEAITLQAGDVLVTGTPAGIGWARKPPLFMKEGDICEVEIESIGILTNPIRNEAKLTIK
ncbi:fumarylacetoacetate hydrolase family protein [Bacillus subtilis]|uniref:fumarylacetoacetate hydrolase family protein n=1 Tax=Pseudochrobactrum asaccharolyticum TaxID=354351 RepID=UPI001F36168F|nr:fumarylacetoacetate hydrolase family protein [Pseudochrobactrum asaccharolyticum]MCF7646578.1 fumarylacetoacetate hydrolase family protein [Pseudochrobactrum asaccharolyticum]MCF7672717.1 fumarylacetoacetate hydrolase family protein [Bacillus subtilis]